MIDESYCEDVNEDFICEVCKEKALDCECGNIIENPDLT